MNQEFPDPDAPTVSVGPKETSRPPARVPQGLGLDPRRPIAPAPGSTPWDSAPVGERGLSQGLPVSYGARPQGAPELLTGVDEVQRRLGPPPAAHPVTVRTGREALPSIARRDRRTRPLTLALYGVVCAISLVGLWLVASVSFGW